MDPLQKYIDAWRGQPFTKFAASFPHGLLVKKPGLRISRGNIGFHTAFGGDAPAEAPDDGFPDWAAVPLLKRPSNPFPDRITIGRATNADVVIRASFISKTHVRVLVGNRGALSVCDGGSSNGSRLNGVPLTSDPVAFLPGDSLDLGALRLTLYDPKEVWALMDSFAHAGASSSRERG